MQIPSPTPYKENRSHGTAAFPCAFYQVDGRCIDGAFNVRHHWHDETEIIYFKRGHYHLEINMDKYDITEECFCFIGSEELHSLFSKQDYSESALVFSADMLSFSSNDPSQSQFIRPLIDRQLSLPRFVTKNHASFSAIKKFYRQITEVFDASKAASFHGEQLSTDDPACQLQLKASILQILAVLARTGALLPAPHNTDHRIEIVKNTITYMKEHFAEKIYISDLAGLVNMNEQYFCRFFKKIIGKSPIAYLNDLRMKQASRLLKETSLSVTDICMECGFNNLGNFMRIFKNTYGITPLQYRKASAGL